MPWFDKLTTRVEKDGRDTSHEGRSMRSKFARFQTRELLLVVLPLWVFYAGSGRLERLTDLKGKRILVGPAGGGTSGLALRMLAANGVTAENATLINRELPDYVDVLAKGEADAGFLVLAPEARTIQRLLRTPSVHLMSFANADAYTQRFPFLTRLVLREGVVDFAANIPPADTTLIATTTAVLVREDAHRSPVNLLAQALHQAHGQP